MEDGSDGSGAGNGREDGGGTSKTIRLLVLALGTGIGKNRQRPHKRHNLISSADPPLFTVQIILLIKPPIVSIRCFPVLLFSIFSFPFFHRRVNRQTRISSSMSNCPDVTWRYQGKLQCAMTDIGTHICWFLMNARQGLVLRLTSKRCRNLGSGAKRSHFHVMKRGYYSIAVA